MRAVEGPLGAVGKGSASEGKLEARASKKQSCDTEAAVSSEKRTLAVRSTYHPGWTNLWPFLHNNEELTVLILSSWVPVYHINQEMMRMLMVG